MKNMDEEVDGSSQQEKYLPGERNTEAYPPLILTLGHLIYQISIIKFAKPSKIVCTCITKTYINIRRYKYGFFNIYTITL